MSGHSKWSTIKRQKGAADAKRGAVFTKLGNSIAIAVREGGGGDPESNFKLRLAMEKAREANMPKENIARSIDRGLGKDGGAAPESALYEGFGPGGVAVLVDAVTDNKTRTGSELRNLFEKGGGSLGSSGAVSYMFTRVGEIELPKEGQPYDAVFEKALEAGAQDIEETEESFLIYTKPEEVSKVAQALGETGSLVYRPNKETMVELTDPVKKGQVDAFLETIGDLDDVIEVYTNTL